MRCVACALQDTSHASAATTREDNRANQHTEQDNSISFLSTAVKARRNATVATILTSCGPAESYILAGQRMQELLLDDL